MTDIYTGLTWEQHSVSIIYNEKIWLGLNEVGEFLESPKAAAACPPEGQESLEVFSGLLRPISLHYLEHS